MSSTVGSLSIPRFPDSSQLSGESTWRTFKDQVLAHVEVRELEGYLDGTIAQPSASATGISSSQLFSSASTTTPAHSPTPFPNEWRQRDRMVANIIYLNITDPIGLGVERSKPASAIWSELKAKYERHDEMRIHSADTKLRSAKFDPSTTTMEEHEKTMKNLLKNLHDLGGSCLDSQFRLILIASMPKSWKDLLINVKGITSEDAFIHLRQVYDNKVEDEEEARRLNQVRALIAQEVSSLASANAASTAKARPVCTNPNCPPQRRVGHTIDRCWAPGGGDEGGGKKKKGSAQKTDTPLAQMADFSNDGCGRSMMELFELCTSSPTTDSSTLCPNAHASRTVSTSTGYGADKERVDVVIDVHTTHPVVKSAPSVQCTALSASEQKPRLYAASKPSSPRTFLDSGASDHFWVRRADFLEYENLYGKAGNSAIAGKAGVFEIHGRGTVEFETMVDGVMRRCRLQGVLHTPSFHHNLVSLRTLDARGMKGEWGKGSLTVRTANGRVVMRGEGRGTMYEIPSFPSTPSANSARSHNKPVDIHTWHRRLGHVSIDRILQMQKLSLVDGLEITSKKVDGKCEPCLLGKAVHRPFDEKLTHETKVLERVHLDLWGQARTQSIGGAVWMFLATDGRSSVKSPTFLNNKRKETVLKAVHEWRIKAEKQTGEKVICWRIDGGGEFDNGWFTDYSAEHGIEIERIPPRSSSSNGMAERANRTVMDGVRTFLVDAGFPPSMWAEAALTFCYVSSFVPSARFPDEVPIEIFTKKRHDVAHLRPFGCKCWATLDAIQTDGKLGVRAVEGRLIGYLGRRAYRLWIPETRTFHESRSVVFEEGDPRRTAPAIPDQVDIEELADVNVGANDEPIVPGDRPSNPTPDEDPRSRSPTPEPVPAIFDPLPFAPDNRLPVHAPIPVPEPGPRRSGRERQPSSRQLESEASAARERSAFERNLSWAHDSDGGVDELENNSMALIVQSPFAFAAESGDKWVPSTYKQAMKRPDLWCGPMQAEYDTLMAKQCWELVDLPPGANLTGGRWVYVIKWTKDGEVAKRKARYVAQGFTQVQGVDYDKTYGAVARMESVRIVLAIIAVLGLLMFQVDFTAAFLNSPISHDVYMKQPEGFEKEGEEDKVCKLGKSIYGTCQGSHDWQDTLGKGYKEDGYVESRADPCVRYRRVKDDYTLTTTYGDDVNGASSTEEGRRRAIADLGKRWESNEVTSGVLLGMAISQDPVSKAVTISQKSYFQRMLDHFGLSDTRIHRTPLDPKAKIEESPNPLPYDDRVFMADKPYRSFVGSVLWGACSTRPDIAFAANFLARFQINPGKVHWDACIWLAGYIRGTIDYSITYRAPPPGDVLPGDGIAPFGYSDSDWASCLVTRRSTAGYIFYMGGAPVSWASKRQGAVALSTVEAEYIGLSKACQQACWLRSFIQEIDLPLSGATLIRGDNFGSVSLTEEPKNHALVKHIDMRDHYIRERVKEGCVKVVRIRTGENVADIMTKALSGPLHAKMVGKLKLERTD